MTRSSTLTNATQRSRSTPDAVLTSTLQRMAETDRQAAGEQWNPKRRRELLRRSNTWRRYLTAIEECGSKALLFECRHDGQRLVYPKRCHRRVHADCAPYVRRRAEARALRIVQRFRHRPLFVTLTSVSEPVLESMMARIHAALTKLRRTRFWHRHVAGGMAAYEITRGPAGWHVHAHLLLDAPFVSREWLVEQWQRALGCRCRRARDRKLPTCCCHERLDHLGSARDPDRPLWARCEDPRCPCKGCGAHPAAQDVRTVQDDASAVHELVKYACKDLGHAKNVTGDTHLLEELLRGLHGKRMLVTFGAHYGRLSDETEQAQHPKCQRCGSREHWAPVGWIDNVLGKSRAYQLDPDPLGAGPCVHGYDLPAFSDPPPWCEPP